MKHVPYGGIAQLARALGSYPNGRWFKSDFRYHNGPLVKRLRHGPFTAVTWVRFPYGSPTKQKGHSQECPFCFADNPYGLRTHLQNIFVLDWVRIVCLALPCRKLARQGIFPYKFSLAPCLTKICLFAQTVLNYWVRNKCSRSEPSRLLYL